MRTFLKYFSIPVLIGLGCISFGGYMAWKEFKFNDALVEAALQGNPYAVKILAKYEKPWKLDQRVILEAVKGNQHALKILNIEDLSS